MIFLSLKSRILSTLLVLITLVAVTTPLPVRATVTAYPGDHIDRHSTLYEVKVNGVPVDVIYHDGGVANHGDTHYAHFEQTGSAVIEVKFLQGNIRPE